MRSAVVMAVLGAAGVMVGAARGAVIGATIADASSGDYTLTSVSVTRGSAGTFTYVPSQLTNVELTDVASFATPLLVPGLNAAVPVPGTRASLLEDWRLDSGVIEPFSTSGGAFDSFEVTFLSPVVNSAGEDILVFDAGAQETTFFYINDDDSAAGNASSPQRVAPANFSSTLLNVNYSLFSYNDGLGNGSQSQNVDSLEELESPTGFTFNSNGTGAGVAAVGLDLSNFGVPLGGTVSSIRFQSVSGRIDPVVIVGLPAVPEPAGLGVLATGALLLRRRRVRSA